MTIIIPVYNAEKFLGACIESVIKQDYYNIEILLIDDGSTDSSSHICNEFARTDIRVKVFHQCNKGVSNARNRGLIEATGKYICFVDADDLVKKNYVSQMVFAMKKYNDKTVVYNTFSYYYHDRALERVPRWAEGVYKSKELMPRIIDDGTLSGILFGSVCGALYVSQFLEQNNILFDEKIVVNEDGLFNIKVIMQIENIIILNGSTYLYRQDNKQDKKFSKAEITQKEIEIAASTSAIAAIEGIEVIGNYACQMRRRYVSTAFWVILSVASSDLNNTTCIQWIKRILLQLSICIEDFDFIHMNLSKKYLLKLMIKKRLITLLILLRYIYPMLQKRIKR